LSEESDTTASSTYPNDAAWANAMNSFASAATAGLHGYVRSSGATERNKLAAGAAACAPWTRAQPPDVVAEEGAFCRRLWPVGTQFFPEAS